MNNYDLQFFGSLEGEVVRILWDKKEATVREVLEVLKKSRPLAYTTVMTVMNRLVDKKVLGRRIENGAYIYASAQDRESFLRGLAGRLISYLGRQFGTVAISQFIDALEDVNHKKNRKL